MTPTRREFVWTMGAAAALALQDPRDVFWNTEDGVEDLSVIWAVSRFWCDTIRLDSSINRAIALSVRGSNPFSVARCSMN